MEISQKLSLVAVFAIILGASQTPSFAGCGSSKVRESVVVTGAGAVAVTRTKGNVSVQAGHGSSHTPVRTTRRSHGSINRRAHAPQPKRLSVEDLQAIIKRGHKAFSKEVERLSDRHYLSTINPSQDALESFKIDYKFFANALFTEGQGKYAKSLAYNNASMTEYANFLMKVGFNLRIALDSTDFTTAERYIHNFHLQLQEAQKAYFHLAYPTHGFVC